MIDSGSRLISITSSICQSPSVGLHHAVAYVDLYSNCIARDNAYIKLQVEFVYSEICFFKHQTGRQEIQN
jgi:hypothetical protein